MLEILVALPHQIRQTRSSRVTTWIARTAQVHLSFRTHILAAIRLFTCQRARLICTPNSHRSSATEFTANVGGNFRYRRRVPRQGSRILASRSAVSTAVGELFSAASFGRFNAGLRRREVPNRITGSGPFEPLSTFGCCDPQRSNVTVQRCGSSTTTDDFRRKVTAKGEPYGKDYAEPSPLLSSRELRSANSRLKGYAVGPPTVRETVQNFLAWQRPAGVVSNTLSRTTIERYNWRFPA